MKLELAYAEIICYNKKNLERNLQCRSATLDVYAVDSANKEFDVEIQRSNVRTCAKRARHNSSLLDVHILKPGDDF